MDKKTLILMKIVKKAVEQGIKPYVIITKFGFGFKEADKVGLKQGDFFWGVADSLNTIKPEKNTKCRIQNQLIFNTSNSINL